MSARDDEYMAEINRLEGERDTLRQENERLKADLDACLAFIRNEMRWCGFRDDFGDSDSQSKQNAKKLEKFLDRFRDEGK